MNGQASGAPCALVTGAAGQDGILLSRLLSKEGSQVVGLVRGAAAAQRLSRLVPGTQVVQGDVTDGRLLRELVDDFRPGEIFNLAGFSSVARSWSSVSEVLRNNVIAVAQMLELVRTEHEAGREVRFYQASSSEVYGLAHERPQNEDTAHHPRSPYGVAKSAAQNLTRNFRESYGLFACSGILYNHESPLRPATFVTRKISLGVASIARGDGDHLVLGNLDVSRDWGWAPDYVRAMRAMLQQDEPQDFVIASGSEHTLRDFITQAFRAVGIEDWSHLVKTDPTLRRPAEVLGLVGDASRARQRLHWQPTLSLGETISTMVQQDLRLLSGQQESLDWLGKWPEILAQ